MVLFQINTSLLGLRHDALSEISEMELIISERCDRPDFHVAWSEIESSSFAARQINSRIVPRMIHPPVPAKPTPGFIIREGRIVFTDL